MTGTHPPYFSFQEIKKSPQSLEGFAVRTGLEPATPCVTGTYSNQLNYRTFYFNVTYYVVNVINY